MILLYCQVTASRFEPAPEPAFLEACLLPGKVVAEPQPARLPENPSNRHARDVGCFPRGQARFVNSERRADTSGEASE